MEESLPFSSLPHSTAPEHQSFGPKRIQRAIRWSLAMALVGMGSWALVFTICLYLVESNSFSTATHIRPIYAWISGASGAIVGVVVGVLIGITRPRKRRLRSVVGLGVSGSLACGLAGVLMPRVIGISSPEIGLALATTLAWGLSGLVVGPIALGLRALLVRQSPPIATQPDCKQQRVGHFEENPSP